MNKPCIHRANCPLVRFTLAEILLKLPTHSLMIAQSTSKIRIISENVKLGERQMFFFFYFFS